MSAKASSQDDYPLNWLRWLAAIVLVAGGIFANSYFGEVALLYRVVGLVVVAAIVLLVLVNTKEGSSVWAIVKESRTEVRKVVWPTRQETNQTTLIVVALVIVMALILWGLDSFFGWLASLIIG